MEALRAWPEKDRLEIFQLPDNEAAIVLLLAGELGTIPVAAVSTETDLPSAATKRADLAGSPQEPTEPYDPSTSEIPY
jgi:hypothetical protein